MTPRHVVLERIVRRAPLAVSAFDMATGSRISDGLRLTARPYLRGTPVYEAQRAPMSGNLGFYSLPELRAYEHGRVSLEDICPDNAPPNYLVVIEDTKSRYLPHLWAMCLPYGERNAAGEFQPRLFEPSLFSSATRGSLGSSFGVVRGELWDATAQRPASWAFVRAVTAGAEAYALSDQRGVFVLYIAFPKPMAQGTPLNAQNWSLAIHVRYQPSALNFHASAPRDAPPDQVSILQQQAASFAETGLQQHNVTLNYLDGAVLATRPAAEEDDGRAWVIPA